MKTTALLTSILLACLGLSALAQVPEKPTRYFNDSAGVVSLATATALNETLAQHERDTTEQIVVAIFPEYKSEQDIAQVSLDMFRAWQIGQKATNNGALLLYYVTSPNGHGKIRIATGRGLEGALTDAQCREICEAAAPLLRKKDYDGAFKLAVQQIIDATKQEYKGDGKTVAEKPADGPSGWWWLLLPLAGAGSFAAWRVTRSKPDPEIDTPPFRHPPEPMRPTSPVYQDLPRPVVPRVYYHSPAPRTAPKPSASKPAPKPTPPPSRSHCDDSPSTSYFSDSSPSYTPDTSSSSSSTDTGSSFDSGGGDTGGGGAGCDV